MIKILKLNPVRKKFFNGVNKKNLNRIIRIALRSIKEGRVLVCSTDTVYGLIADATNKKAVKKLFKIKKRKKDKAIPIFVKDIKMAKKLAEIDKEREKILKKLWFTRPNFKETWAGKGKVTVVLKRKKSKVKLYGVDKKTIGLRVPNYKLINILLSKLNLPLTGTSANVSGKRASAKIKEVILQFNSQKNLPDLILDAGNLKRGLPSTVVDLTKKKQRDRKSH